MPDATDIGGIIGNTFGLGGVQLDSLTSLLLTFSFVFGIGFIVVLILWKTKMYKRFLYSWPITVLYWDHRAGANPPAQIDRMRRVRKDGVEYGMLLKKGEKMNFPSLSEFHQIGRTVLYIAHRLETDVWLPVKVNLSNPSAEIISELKDMKYSTNLKNVMDRETRFRYQKSDWLSKIAPLLPFIGVGIMILLVLYANYTYLWTPMASRVDTETKIVEKLYDIVSALRGTPVNNTPPVVAPPA